jgi:putative RecB family exonuclease
LPVYSHSRLSSFEKCPLQYRYRYIDRIKRDTQSIEAFLGNRVHEALERLYRDLMSARPPASLDELVALYHRNWEGQYSDRVRIVKTDRTAADYRAIGQACIEGYYRRHHPFDRGATVGLEEHVVLDLDETARGRFQLQGYIDRLARAEDGAYEIHDYKTSSYLPADAELRRDRQLTLYQMAVQKRFPDAGAVRLVWHYLAFDRTLTSERTPEEIERHRRQTIGVIRTVEAATSYPARESALCRWCEYRDICPAQKPVLEAERAAAAGAAATRTPAPAATRPAPAARPPVPAARPPVPAGPRRAPVQGRLFD